MNNIEHPCGEEVQRLYDNLPLFLRENARFCLWRYEQRKGKPTKVPYQVNGRRADSTDIATFSSFEDAIAVIDDYDGIGMGVFGKFIAIDIDNCVIDGKLTDMAQDIISTMDSYTEYSPSGTGIRIIGTAESLSYEKEKYYINNCNIHLEVYVAGYTEKAVTFDNFFISKPLQK